MEDKLDCDNYAMLATYFFDLISKEEVSFSFVGWHGGAVGNHAQIFVRYGNVSVLLDPTVGVAAFADFNGVAKGIPVRRIIDFHHRDELQKYRARVIRALLGGMYKPSDLLYYFESFENFKSPPVGSLLWPTPGAATLRRGSGKI